MTGLEVVILCSFGCLVVGFVMGFIYYITNSEIFGYLCFAFVMLFGVSIVCCYLRATVFAPLPEQYQEKVRNIEEAKINLEHFLIDHPEFREEGGNETSKKD